MASRIPAAITGVLGAIGVVALAVAIPLAAFEYQSHQARQSATHKAHADGQASSAQVVNEETALAGGRTKESVDKPLAEPDPARARMDEWKRSLEESVQRAEALKEARQQGRAKADEQGAESAKRTELGPQKHESLPIGSGIPQEIRNQQARTSKDRIDAQDLSEAKTKSESTDAPTDLGIVREIEKQQAKTANAGIEASKTNETETTESGPFAGNPMTDARETESTNGRVGAVPSERPESLPATRAKGHYAERRHWRRWGEGGGWRSTDCLEWCGPFLTSCRLSVDRGYPVTVRLLLQSLIVRRAAFCSPRRVELRVRPGADCGLWRGRATGEGLRAAGSANAFGSTKRPSYPPRRAEERNVQDWRRAATML